MSQSSQRPPRRPSLPLLLAGLVVVLFWIIGYISQLFETVQTMFQL